MTALKPYRVEFRIRAGRDSVRAAVSELPVLRQWFGWDFDGLEAEIRQLFVDQVKRPAPETLRWADGSSLEITGDDDRSVVRVTRKGPKPDYPDAFDAIEEAWKAFLVQLRHLLEERPEGRRRTLYLTGKSTGRQVFDLVGGKWQRVGTRVAAAVVEDALVVVSGNEPLDGPEPAAVQVVVSTYGLDDDAFADRRGDWAKRWAAVADGAVIPAD